MTPRWIGYFIFLGLVITGNLLSHYSHDVVPAPPAVWLSSRTLPLNTRISAIDLQEPKFPTPASALGLPDMIEVIGLYTLDEIPKGKEVTPDKLGKSPNVSVEKDESLMFYEVQKLGPAATQLNANAKVYVCEPNGPCTNGPYTVKAVLGKEAREPPAMIIICVNTVQAESLRALSKPEVKIAAFPYTQKNGAAQ
jgi:hypothetical protein